MRACHGWLKLSNWVFSFRGYLWDCTSSGEERGCRENLPSNFKYCPANWIPLPYFLLEELLWQCTFVCRTVFEHSVPVQCTQKLFFPLSLKWGEKFRKARLANQCRVAPPLGLPGQGQPLEWAEMIAWVKNSQAWHCHRLALRLEALIFISVSVSKLGMMFAFPESIFHGCLSKMYNVQNHAATEKFLLVMVAGVMMKVKLMMKVKGLDCQGPNPTSLTTLSITQIECYSAQIPQSSVCSHMRLIIVPKSEGRGKQIIQVTCRGKWHA